MRISDWSSDVCSSDLAIDAILGRLDRPGDRDHPLIVVEHPADVAIFGAIGGDAVAADEFDHHEGEGARHAAVLQLLDHAQDRKSTRLNASPYCASRMPSSAGKTKIKSPHICTIAT